MKDTTVKILAHSKSSIDGKEIVSFELEYPRIIHSENLTHRVTSRNASSSRAIPVSAVNEMVMTDPAMPVRFGKNQSGMQDHGEEHDGIVFLPGVREGMSGRNAWKYAATLNAEISAAFNRAGYHKQVCNRITEPYQWMKVVVTTTELENFFWLRDHPAADPTIADLAKKMKEALEASTPVVLKPGDWHTPYYMAGYWIEEKDGLDKHGNTLDTALAISMSCCAQVSYRKLDGSIEKAETVKQRLNLGVDDSEPCHASPTEHQASPIRQSRIDDEWHDRNAPANPYTWCAGVTHVDRDGKFWSGNFCGWIQHRQLIPNNVKKG